MTLEEICIRREIARIECAKTPMAFAAGWLQLYALWEIAYQLACVNQGNGAKDWEK